MKLSPKIFLSLLAYAKLVRALYKDPRTPKSFKIGVWVLIAYFFIPVDIVSDFIPILGQIDDLIIITLGLKWLIRLCPKSLVEEHRS